MDSALGLLVMCLTVKDVVENDPLRHLGRFPSYQYAVHQRDFHGARAEYLRVHHCIHEPKDSELIELSQSHSLRCSRPWLRDKIIFQYIRARYEWSCWAMLAQAANSDGYRYNRETALSSLRVMIGEESWAAGQMPITWPR